MLAERDRIAGWLLVGMGALAMLHAGFGTIPAWWSGIAAWLAAALLVHRISGIHRMVVAAITGIGALGLMVGWALTDTLPWSQAISQNHTLLTMLAAVTFLRLISLPPTQALALLPVGHKAFRQTVLGTHLFGAVINISALIIIADRLTQDRPLDRTGATLFSRAFSSCAFWSPFIGGTGIVLAYVDGAELPKLMMVGIPLAGCALAFAYFSARLSGSVDLDSFRGYPIRFDSLAIPAMLGIGVLIIHDLVPSISILIVIAFTATILTITVLALRVGAASATTTLRGHIEQRLPQLAQELSLFLAAGVLATGVGNVVAAVGDPIPFSTLDAATASLTLGVMILLAMLGIHPIIMVSIIAVMIVPLSPDPNLAALMFLMTWAIGVAASPLSGTHLILQGRYGVAAWKVARWNFGYCLTMYGLAIIALYIYDAL